MWVRSQNKKELVNCISFSVVRNYFGGQKKYAINGTISCGVFGKNEEILGLYDTEDMGLNELTRIQEELIKDTKLYEMS